MSAPPICPCAGVEHPANISNLPELSAVQYRAGDFRSFRRALLQPLPSEAELTAWRAAPEGDLALQILEWCAYIADVLTFYNERSINSNLLATATLDADVRGLVRILGYRARPGIGGSAVVSTLLSGPRPVSLPAGFRLQSKPAPGKQPQTFETTDPHSLAMPDAVSAAPPGILAGAAGQLYLDGTVKSIHAGDLLLLAPQIGFDSAVLIPVHTVNHRKDNAGSAYTEIVPSSGSALPTANAAGYRLLRSGHSLGLWKYKTGINLFSSPMDMEGVDRTIAAGQVMVATAPGTSLGVAILNVDGTEEQIWYTNGEDTSPPASPTPPAGSPHTRIYWSSLDTINTDAGPWDNHRSAVQVLVDWQPAGTLRNVPVATYDGTPMTLVAAAGMVFQVANQQKVLIEDANGNGVLATVSVDAGTPDLMTIASFAVTPPPLLKTPLRVLHNVIDLTRGKAIDSELLGSGDATLSNQEFVLQKSPLTYLPAGDSYKSTLAIYVNGVQWMEVASLYDQPSNAQIFVTFEDDQQKTHVKFGDGVNGSLVSSGAAIIARYRIESGFDAPAAGALTVVTKPFNGLRAVRYPVAGGGGADPDPPDKIRRYAPLSVLTFGRAISADDYEAIAAGAPSVQRVRAYYAWNPNEQRATVTLYVGDTDAAVAAAQDALQTSADPNRPVSVEAATAVFAFLFIAIRVQPGRILDDVVARVRSGLADPDTGLFGAHRTGIGESFYFSQMSDKCQSVEGVDAVSGAIFLLLRPDPQTGLYLGLPPRINAGLGEYFSISPEWVWIFPEVLTSV
jgi:hypothetical protein